jgi:hypothetical protein
VQRCRNALPSGPFDRIGPKTRPGLYQTDIMFNSRFVIRNNPIGAIFDQIRAFCSPMPQEQQGDEGGYVAEEPYLSTPEYSSFDSGPTYAGGAGYLVGGPPSSPLTPTASPCGPGTIWDAGLGQCTLPAEAPAETPNQERQRQLRERGRKAPKKSFGYKAKPGKASVNV